MPLSTASISARRTSRSAIGRHSASTIFEKYKGEIVEYYRANLKLLKALADAYGFGLDPFYQPNGLLDNTNPFVSRATPAGRPAIATSRSWLPARVRRSLRGEVLMIDISDALADMPGPRYLDIAHYSPEANAVLARSIASHMR